MGIAIGVGAVIVMLHVGHSATAAAKASFGSWGIDVALLQSKSREGRETFLQKETVEGLRTLGEVEDVAPIVTMGAIVRLGRAGTSTTVLATTEAIFRIGRGEIAEGRSISVADQGSLYAVVGAELAKELGRRSGGSLKIGDHLIVGDQLVTVVGIMRSVPANIVLNLDFNQSLLVPLGAARQLDRASGITHVAVKLSPGSTDRKAREAIRTYMAGKGVDRITLQSAKEMIAGIDEQMRIYGLLVAATAGIALIVGGGGALNVMLMSVMERRREIGLRQAIGARGFDIGLMFLTESLLLALMGSALGTAGGYAAAGAFGWVSGWMFFPSPMAIPLGITMATIIGLVAGLLPAYRAARLDPVISLRGD